MCRPKHAAAAHGRHDREGDERGWLQRQRQQGGKGAGAAQSSSRFLSCSKLSRIRRGSSGETGLLRTGLVLKLSLLTPAGSRLDQGPASEEDAPDRACADACADNDVVEGGQEDQGEGAAVDCEGRGGRVVGRVGAGASALASSFALSFQR